MLSDLLADTSFSPWIDTARSCLSVIHPPDIEIFLLHAFARHQDKAQAVLDELTTFQTNQWTALAGVTQALIWLGVREYTHANQVLIEEAFEDSGKGWSVFLDFDVADVMPGSAAENWKTLSSMVSEERRQKVEEMQSRQTDKKAVFNHVRQWLASRTQKPEPPVVDADWTAMAEALFWAGHLGISWPVDEWLRGVPLDAVVQTLSIGVLGDVVLGMSEGYSSRFASWMHTNRPRLMARFREATQTIVLEDDGEKLCAHFIVEIEQSSTTDSVLDARVRVAKDRFHEEAVVRVDLLRRLLPDRELYACQGYGHKLWLAEMHTDSTQKMGIARKHLPPLWLTSVNTMFRGLAERDFRPKTWLEYVDLLMTLRRDTHAVLRQLVRGMELFFRSRTYVSLFGNAIDSDQWVSSAQRLNHPSLLPSCVLDEWGFLDEYSSEPVSLQIREQTPLTTKNGIAFQAYKSYLDAFRSYTTSLSNFFEQSIHVMALNAALGRNAKGGAARARIFTQVEESGLKTNLAHLSTFNFAEAVKALPQFQQEFRHLLSQYVPEEELARLERQELHTHRQAWDLWYFFAHQPLRVVSHPQRLLGEVAESMKRMRRALMREVRTLSQGQIAVQIVSETAHWDGEPVLWLSIDGEDTAAVYQAFEEVLRVVRKAVRSVPDTQLRRCLLEFHWRYLVVVPLVRGKSLASHAWHVYLPVVLEEGELKWWNYFQTPMPAEAVRDLAITQWHDERLEPAQRFLAATTELSLYAAHVGDFNNMPAGDEEGLNQLQEYIIRISPQLNRAWQSAIDTGAVLIDSFNAMPPGERLEHPHLTAAVEALIEMQGALVPESIVEGTVTMTVTETAEWAERLRQARHYAGLVYFSLVSDCLQSLRACQGRPTFDPDRRLVIDPPRRL
jgi:hypothetical protein